MQIVFNIAKSSQTKIWLLNKQAGEDETIYELHEVISSLQYRNVINVEHFLNYPSENHAVMNHLLMKRLFKG